MQLCGGEPLTDVSTLLLSLASQVCCYTENLIFKSSSSNNRFVVDEILDRWRLTIHNNSINVVVISNNSNVISNNSNVISNNSNVISNNSQNVHKRSYIFIDLNKKYLKHIVYLATQLIHFISFLYFKVNPRNCF